MESALSTLAPKIRIHPGELPQAEALAVRRIFMLEFQRRETVVEHIRLRVRGMVQHAINNPHDFGVYRYIQRSDGDRSHPLPTDFCKESAVFQGFVKRTEEEDRPFAAIRTRPYSEFRGADFDFWNMLHLPVPPISIVAYFRAGVQPFQPPADPFEQAAPPGTPYIPFAISINGRIAKEDFNNVVFGVQDPVAGSFNMWLSLPKDLVLFT